MPVGPEVEPMSWCAGPGDGSRAVDRVTPGHVGRGGFGESAASSTVIASVGVPDGWREERAVGVSVLGADDRQVAIEELAELDGGRHGPKR